MYHLPPIKVLNDPVRPVKGKYEASAMLTRTLAEFGVKSEVTGVQRGPSITRYELRPGVGVKISRIQSLADNLALAMAVPSIRIQPIEGRSALGVEIPNAVKDVVTLSQILPRALNREYALPMALGIDVDGNPVIADLTKMPHLLVAGATGSGKSVCLNNIIMTLLTVVTPDYLELVMIDPKRVELTPYNGIPHMRGEVITNAEDAAPVLDSLIAEMERRSILHQQARVRTIDEYNAKSSEPMRYIVVVIDELADLMMIAKKEVESSLCRLAARSRAVGIHLVVATQRPSVDVVTGLLKTNIPSRLAFAVASDVDSRTILDQGGAENLLGRGDMLFLPISAARPIRAQAALVTTPEIERVVDIWKAQGKPRDAMQITKQNDEAFVRKGDSLLDRAISYVRERNKASVAELKEHLSVGHARAKKIMVQLEEAGVVGPDQGPIARVVYPIETKDEQGEDES